jgi:hypothetical protein
LKNTFFILFFFVASFSFAQISIEQQTIGSTGGFSEGNRNYNISYTGTRVVTSGEYIVRVSTVFDNTNVVVATSVVTASKNN